MNMKKFLIPLAFVLISICSVNGQTSFGVKGGVNVSYMNIDMRESLVSFHAGLFSRIALSEQAFLQPELLYSVKGAKFPEYFYPFDMNFTFNYISMPILFGWKATKNFSIMAGPEISYLADAQLEVGEYGPDGTDGFSTWDFCLDLGVAYQITKGLGVDLRFGYGLVDVVNILFTDANGQTVAVFNEGRNRTIQLGVNYKVKSEE